MSTAILALSSPHDTRRAGIAGWFRAGLPTLLAGATLSAGWGFAGPMLCTTTLEAPPVSSGSADQENFSLVEVTRCGPTQTVPDMVTRRFYGWTSPFARGVSLTHQITNLLGIAMGGGDGTKVMGFGYYDQTLIWDGSALNNTAGALMEEQFVPMPIRTSDLPSVFGSSIGDLPVIEEQPLSPQPPDTWSPPIRGMW
jgi:hypothetical protein